jgi:hypothetical protein
MSKIASGQNDGNLSFFELPDVLYWFYEKVFTGGTPF